MCFVFRSRTALAFIASTSFVVLAHATFPQTAQAQTPLFSNLNATPPSDTASTLLSTTFQKAIAFTTGSGFYSLESVQASLSVNNTGSSVISFALYTPSVAGGSDPGALAVSLGSQTVNNLRANPQTYTFTPSSAFTMNPNTRYVLLCDLESGDSGRWLGTDPDRAPTARNNSGFTDPVYRLSTDNGASYTTSIGVSNQFAINGTETPEPDTLPLALLGFTIGAGWVKAARRSH